MAGLASCGRPSKREVYRGPRVGIQFYNAESFPGLCQPAVPARGGRTAISLAWIGDYEIRMHAAPSGSAAEQPLFIVDIFDHDAQLSIGSRACHSVAEGATAFDEFLYVAEPVAGGPH